MTTKQRSALRAQANTVDASLQIGKGGISASLITSISQQLEARELVKITILSNCEISAKQMMEPLCQTLQAEPIQQVGNKIILYRRSSRKDVKHLVF